MTWGTLDAFERGGSVMATAPLRVRLFNEPSTSLMSVRASCRGMSRFALVLAVLMGIVAAGCATPADAPGPAAAEGPDAADGGGWPPLDEAPVRPGVRLGELHARPGALGGKLCTGNFIFQSPDNASLYLGTAAHCVRGMKPGDAVAIEGVGGRAGATGTLAYSSFVAMDVRDELSPRLSEDEDAAPHRDNNDFALIRIDDAHRRLVHPATLHYGGPTGIVPSGEIGVGARVLLYGSSATKGEADALSVQAGCVVRPGPRASRLHMDNPGVPGDSGGPVLRADGRALGVLTHFGPGVATDPPLVRGGTNYVTNLDMALAYAREVFGLHVELVTWPRLGGAPLLPELPCPAPPAQPPH